MAKTKSTTRKRKPAREPYRRPRPVASSALVAPSCLDTHAECIERARQLIDSHTRKLQTGVHHG